MSSRQRARKARRNGRIIRRRRRHTEQEQENPIRSLRSSRSHRLIECPRTARPGTIEQLQRLCGNRAVIQMMATADRRGNMVQRTAQMASEISAPARRRQSSGQQLTAGELTHAGKHQLQRKDKPGAVRFGLSESGHIQRLWTRQELEQPKRGGKVSWRPKLWGKISRLFGLYSSTYTKILHTLGEYHESPEETPSDVDKKIETLGKVRNLTGQWKGQHQKLLKRQNEKRKQALERLGRQITRERRELRRFKGMFALRDSSIPLDYKSLMVVANWRKVRWLLQRAKKWKGDGRQVFANPRRQSTYLEYQQKEESYLKILSSILKYRRSGTERAKLLTAPGMLEKIDPKHREAMELAPLWKQWVEQSIGKPFFRWVSEVEKKRGTLFPRVTYLGERARERYVVRFQGNIPTQKKRQAMRGESLWPGDPLSPANGTIIYAMDPSSKKFYANYETQATMRGAEKRFHHSSLLAGAAVGAAGHLIVGKTGVLRKIDLKSGHYRPSYQHMINAIEGLRANRVDTSRVKVDLAMVTGAGSAEGSANKFYEGLKQAKQDKWEPTSEGTAGQEIQQRLGLYIPPKQFKPTRDEVKFS